jgi:serine/threonine-protein kinase
MKQFVLLIFVLVLSACSSPSGAPVKSVTIDGWKAYEKGNFNFQYPADWDLDESGQMGTSFFLFSRLDSDSDDFKENINLLIQDVGAHQIDLDKFVKLSEDQIKRIVTHSNLIESKRVERDGQSYQMMNYTGDQGQFHLHHLQYYFVEDGKAYILTFTAEQDQFEKFKVTAEKILASFRVAS